MANTVNEIRTMIEEARKPKSDDGGLSGQFPVSPRITDIMEALLDSIDALSAQTEQCILPGL